jgi:CRP-like cAMP-binding protein
MIQFDELANMDSLSGFGESELNALASIGTLVSWQEGETLFVARSPAHYLQIIRSGSVLLCFPDGRCLRTQEPGQILGWSSLINPYRYTGTGICLTDVDLYQFPREELFRFLQMDSDFAQSLMELVTSTMKERKPYFRRS